MRRRLADIDYRRRLNWNSYFVGASALIGATDPFELGGDVFVGVTATTGDFLYGGVLSAGALSGDDNVSYHVELASRLGALIINDIASYAIIGGGYETEVDSSYVVVGGGVSVALTDNMSVEAGLKGNYLTDAPASDDNWRLIGALGMAFHF